MNTATSSSLQSRRKSILNWLPRYFLLGVATVSVVALISYISKRFHEDGNVNPILVKKGGDLLKQAAEWTFSAQQTDNPILALRNANYATAYFNLARNLASDVDLTNITKIPVNDLKEDVKNQEEKARTRVLELCPQAGGKGRVAAFVGYNANHNNANNESVGRAGRIPKMLPRLPIPTLQPQFQQQQQAPPQQPQFQPQPQQQHWNATYNNTSNILQAGGYGSLQQSPPIPQYQDYYSSQPQQQYPATYRVT